MEMAIIDLDPEMDGIQEGKEWIAVMEFLKTMKDTNGNMIPDIDSRYTTPQKALVTTEK